MPDIKELYLSAKRQGTQDNINQYIESIDYCLYNKPTDFLYYLEYIIKSNAGLQKLDTFIEKHGLSMYTHDSILESLYNLKDKLESKESADDNYKISCDLMIEKVESDLRKYPMCYSLSEETDLTDEWLSVYYHPNKDSYNIRRLFERYGDMILPDVIKMGIESNSVDYMKIVESGSLDDTGFEKLYQCCIDAEHLLSEQDRNKLYESSLTGRCDKIMTTSHRLIQESVLLGDEDAMCMYTGGHLNCLIDLISLKESMNLKLITISDQLSFTDDIIELYNEMVSITDAEGNSVLSIEEDVADNISPLLVGSESRQKPKEIKKPPVFKEGLSYHRYKRHGKIPPHLVRNHPGLKWGEGDPNSEDEEAYIDGIEDDGTANDGMDIDSYRKNNDTEELPEPDSDYGDDTDYQSDDNEVDDVSKPSGSGNNYYYYTYNDSNNTNHRTDNSTNDNRTFRDDHSTGKTLSDMNKKTISKVDDHSKNKGSEKDPLNVNVNIDGAVVKKGKDDAIKEAVNSTKDKRMNWELDLGNTRLNSKYMAEAVDDVDFRKPGSNNKFGDKMQDFDMQTGKAHEDMKKKATDAYNNTQIFLRPAKRFGDWTSQLISDWRHKKEIDIKEKMSDPKARSSLLAAAKKAILYGSLWKAGLLFNPLFMYLAITSKHRNKQREFRIRNQLISEIKTDIEILDDKINTANINNDVKAQAELKRLRRELKQKLIRTSGDRKYRRAV